MRRLGAEFPAVHEFEVAKIDDWHANLPNSKKKAALDTKIGRCYLQLEKGTSYLIGPVGAVAGSLAGYLISSSVYHSCIAIIESGKLAREHADRVEALCEEAIRRMIEERREFERAVEENLKIRRQEFQSCFRAMEKSLAENSHEEAVLAFSSFSALLRKKLKLESFEEFDNFMRASDEPLRL